MKVIITKPGVTDGNSILEVGTAIECPGKVAEGLIYGGYATAEKAEKAIEGVADAAEETEEAIEGVADAAEETEEAVDTAPKTRKTTAKKTK